MKKYHPKVTLTSKLQEQEYLVAWLKWSGDNLSPATQRRRKAAVSNYTRFARGYEAGFLDDLRTVPADPRVPHPLPGLSETLGKMVVQAWMMDDFQLAALVSMGGYLGCRVSESISLTPGCFNLREMEVTILGKGRKKRVVPVSKNAWTGVRDAYDEAASMGRHFGLEHPLVRMQDRSARSKITNLGEMLGLDRPIASHDLRSTFATEAYQACKDALIVMRLMGHAKIEDTLPYIQEDAIKRREAVNF